MANSVVHFEIFATNVERARKFYERAFGWRFGAAGPPDFYLRETGPDNDPGLTHGLLAKRRGPPAQGPINAFRCTIGVRSIKDAAAAVEAAGGSLRSAVAEIPEVGKVVEIADTEDNIVEHFATRPATAARSRWSPSRSAVPACARSRDCLPTRRD